jgi:hypothetical protein
MAQELFSNIIDAVRDAFRHLGNANTMTLAAAAAVVVVLAYFLLRR